MSCLYKLHHPLLLLIEVPQPISEQREDRIRILPFAARIQWTAHGNVLQRLRFLMGIAPQAEVVLLKKLTLVSDQACISSYHFTAIFLNTMGIQSANEYCGNLYRTLILFLLQIARIRKDRGEKYKLRQLQDASPNHSHKTMPFSIIIQVFIDHQKDGEENHVFTQSGSHFLGLISG